MLFFKQIFLISYLAPLKLLTARKLYGMEEVFDSSRVLPFDRGGLLYSTKAITAAKTL